MELEALLIFAWLIKLQLCTLMGKHHPACIYYICHFNVHERTQKWREGLGTLSTELFTSQTNVSSSGVILR